jgi:hypothetical protein
VVKHCYKRWEDSGEISADDINQVREGEFLVKSQSSEEVYTVNFSPGEFPVPCCSCEDWRKFHLICKHFCAIFRHTSWKWEQLPIEYRNNPFITIDEDVLHQFHSQITDSTSVVDRESEPVEQNQPLPLPSKSRLSKVRAAIFRQCDIVKDFARGCTDEKVLYNLYDKLQNTSDTFKGSVSNETLQLDDPRKKMTYIGTTKAKRLSLSKKKSRGSGRKGISAERQRVHTSKGVDDILNAESGMYYLWCYFFYVKDPARSCLVGKCYE